VFGSEYLLICYRGKGGTGVLCAERCTHFSYSVFSTYNEILFHPFQDGGFMLESFIKV